jgi:hypothetical protein
MTTIGGVDGIVCCATASPLANSPAAKIENTKHRMPQYRTKRDTDW